MSISRLTKVIGATAITIAGYVGWKSLQGLMDGVEEMERDAAGTYQVVKNSRAHHVNEDA